MNLFEFIMTLLSILIGLAIAEVLAGAAKVIRRRVQQPPSWLHAAFVVGTFLVLVQLWWESWNLRTLEAWTMATLLMFITPPVCIFVIAHLIFPEGDEPYEEHYLANARVIWPLIAVASFAAVMFRPLALGTGIGWLDSASSFASIGIALVLAVSERRALHRVLIPIVVIGICLDIFLGIAQISER